MSNSAGPFYIPKRGDRPQFKLIGDVSKKVLQDIFTDLEAGKGGKVYYIKGEGGTGKTEALSIIHEKMEEHNYEKILYSGIVDLYNYDFFSPITLFRELFENIQHYWEEEYNNKIKTAGRIAKQTLEKENEELVKIFEGLEQELQSYFYLRFAFPGFQEARQLLSDRRQNLVNRYFKALNELADNKCLLVCVDTAELLRNDDPLTPDEQREVLDWIEAFIKAPCGANAILVIAGREASVQSSSNIALTQTPQTRAGTIPSIPLEDYLRKVCSKPKPPRQFIQENFGFTTTKEVKDYVNEYREVYNISETLKLDYNFVKELTSGKPLYIDWLCQLYFHKELGHPRNLLGNLDSKNLVHSRNNFYGTLANYLADETHRESWMQWAYFFAIEARKGLDEDILAYLFTVFEEALTPAEKKYIQDNGVGEIFKRLKNDPFIKVREVVTSQDTNKKTRIFLHDEIYKSFYHLIYKQDWGRYSNAARKVSLMLAEAYSHIEEYPIEEPPIEDSSLATNPPIMLKNPLSMRRVERELRKKSSTTVKEWEWLDKSSGKPTPGTGGSHFDEYFWFQDKKVVVEHVKETEHIQNILLERMYYRLADNSGDNYIGYLSQGYDEYAFLAMVAGREYQYGFDIRIKKEFLRFERDYFLGKLEELIKLCQNEKSEEIQAASVPTSSPLDLTELEIPKILRLLDENNKDSLSINQSLLSPTDLRHLVLRIADYANSIPHEEDWEEEWEQLRSFNSLREVEGDLRATKRVLRGKGEGENEPTWIHGKYYSLNEPDEIYTSLLDYTKTCLTSAEAFKKMSDEYEQKAKAKPESEAYSRLAAAFNQYYRRAMLTAADSIVTIYDYVGLFQTNRTAGEERKGLQEAEGWIKLIESESEPRDYFKPRDYDYWLCNLLLAKIHYNLGRVARTNHYLPLGLSEFKNSIHYFKNAHARSIDVSLNDARASIAYNYLLMGQERIAEEICDLVISAQVKLGHAGYVALAYNILSQILVNSDRHLVSAYEAAKKARSLILEACDGNEDEAIKLPQYNHICMYMSRAARRVARHYYESDQVVANKFLIEAETTLTEVLKRQALGLRYEALNELGCVYRTWAYCLKIFDSHNNTKELQDKIKKGRNYYNEALKKADTDVQKVDTLIDLAELEGHYAGFDKALPALKKAETLMKNYRLVGGKTFKQDELQPQFYLSWSNSYFQKAELERLSFDQDKSVNDTDNELHLRHYSAYMIWALAYLHKFQPALLNEENGDYVRDTGIIEAMERNLTQVFGRVAQRLRLVKFLKELFPQIDGDTTAPLSILDHNNAVIISGSDYKVVRSGLKIMNTILDLGLPIN